MAFFCNLFGYLFCVIIKEGKIWECWCMFERRSTRSFKGEIGPGLDHFSNCFMFLHQSNKFQVLQVPMKKVNLNSGITIGIIQSPWTRLQPLHNSEKVLKTWRDWQMYNCVHIFVYPSVEAIGKCITVCLVWPSVEETRQIYCCVYISAEETQLATAAVQLNERMAPPRRGSRNRGYKPLLWNLPPDIKRFHSEKMSKIQI